jgi:hypothetical protein
VNLADERTMRALSIRQPYAELIVRGIKTLRRAQGRRRSCGRGGTTIVGQRFYVYAAKAKAKPPVPICSEDLRVATPQKWMIELAEQVGMIEPGAILPSGAIDGSAVIEEVIPPDPSDGESGLFRWNLNHIKRLATPRKPKGHPQPVQFTPF